jgi:hypothetical protein
VNEAFSQYYRLNYLTNTGETDPEIDWDECTDFITIDTLDTLQICKGDFVLLFLEGNIIDDYDWIWTPEDMLIEVTGNSTYAIPKERATYSEKATLIAEGGDTYEWFPTSGLSDPTLAITDASPIVTIFYSVVIGSDSVTCSDTLMVTVFVEPADIDTAGLSLDEIGLNTFKFYPNPFDDFTIIHFDKTLSTSHTITIYNLLGKEFYRNENVIGENFKIENQQWESVRS